MYAYDFANSWGDFPKGSGIANFFDSIFLISVGFRILRLFSLLRRLQARQIFTFL